RCRLAAAARPGAVSAIVPSKWNRTSSDMRPSGLGRTQGGQHIVDVGVRREVVRVAQWVVGEATGMRDLQASLAASHAKFTWANEVLVVVRAPRKQAQHEFGSHDGMQERLQVP